MYLHEHQVSVSVAILETRQQTSMASTSSEKYQRFIRKARNASCEEDYLKYLGKAIKYLQKMEEEILEDDFIYERRAA